VAEDVERTGGTISACRHASRIGRC
jgi:hypothetical protein